MCGGIVSALSMGGASGFVLHLAYNSGRIVSYAAAGAIAGALGGLSLTLSGQLPVRIALYLLANLISILQMTVFKHWFIDEEKIRAQLLLNMKTPKKKSKWQQRLEDLQKQQQQARKR